MSIELPSAAVDAFYFLGLPWPGVDEDQLRGWGSDLRTFAEEITAVAGLSKDAVKELADSDQSAFLKTVAGNWEQHHGTIMALREPMNVFADALDVAAVAVEVQKGVVIAAAVALAAEVVATQGEALVTFGLAEAELPLEVAATKLAIKFALQELENALLGVLIDDAAQAIGNHLGSSVEKLLMGGLGVAGEAYALKTDTKGIRGLAKTINTHARRTERTSEEAHRRTANRKLETESPGGRWHVVEVLEAALLSIAGDLFKKLPGTLFKVMEKTEEDLTKAAEAIEQADARLAAETPLEEPGTGPPLGEGGEPGGTESPSDMGTRRGQRDRTAQDSTEPAPPQRTPDGELISGDPVYYKDGATAVGYDGNTLANYDLVAPEAGYHDVVVHGNNQGYFEPGRVNAYGTEFPGGEVHPSHIADAVRNNPSYDGGPVRLVSCHSGTVAEVSMEIPAAQAVANQLGVPVKAPTDTVGVFPARGPGQTPKVFNGGHWRIFLPMAQ